MSVFEIQLAPGAETDIAEALSWYLEFSVDSAELWRAKIIEANRR